MHVSIRVFVLIACIATWTRGWSQDRMVKTSRPNILICIADDASYPFMSAYGCPWVQTPGFDWVAAHGILFTRAYTPNAKCGPSRSCIITGRNSWQLEAAANHWAYFPAKFKTYAEVLKDNGYYTGYTGKGWAPGIPGQVNGQTRELVGAPFQRLKTVPPTPQMSKIDYAANFQAFLKSKPSDQPFCFWYGGHEAHRGYTYGSGVKAGLKKSSIDKVPPFWPDTDSVRTDMLDYAFELQYFDQQLMKMLQMLSASGELDNTLIVVTADNGMPFPRVKGQAYALSNHEPLAIMWTNGIKNPGREVHDLVSLIDLAPTFLELAGVDAQASGMQPMAGKSLTSIFYAPGSGKIDPKRSYVLIGKERHDVGRPEDQGYPIRGLVTDDYLYLHNFKTDRWPAGNPETGYLNVDGSPTKTACIIAGRNPMTIRYWQWAFGKRPADALYALTTDPDCIDNLAIDPRYRQVEDSLRRQLFRALKKQGDPRMSGQGAIFDQYPYADPTSRHFYERYMKGEKMKAGWVHPSDFDTAYPRAALPAPVVGEHRLP